MKIASKGKGKHQRWEITEAIPGSQLGWKQGCLINSIQSMSLGKRE